MSDKPAVTRKNDSVTTHSVVHRLKQGKPKTYKQKNAGTAKATLQRVLRELKPGESVEVITIKTTSSIERHSL